MGTPGQKAFYNYYLGKQKETWALNAKHETFLHISKQDCFLFSFLLFINDKKGKGLCEKVWEPFWIIPCYLVEKITRWFTAELFILK